MSETEKRREAKERARRGERELAEERGRREKAEVQVGEIRQELTEAEAARQQQRKSTNWQSCPHSLHELVVFGQCQLFTA